MAAATRNLQNSPELAQSAIPSNAAFMDTASTPATQKFLLRIFIDKFQKWHHRSTYHEIVERARDEGIAGASVLQGMEGFGQNGRVLQKHFWLPSNEEMIVEIIDDEHKLRSFLESIEPILKDAVVTLQPMRVIRYFAEGKKHIA
jgi:uncharacterized protein